MVYYLKCDQPNSNHLAGQLMKESAVFEGIDLLPGDFLTIGIGKGLWKIFGFRHIGIYLGHIDNVPYVVHFTEGGLRLDPLGDGWRDTPRLEYRPTSDRLYQRAFDRLLNPEKEGNYDLLTNNCISFARRCLEDEAKPFSKAVNSNWLKMKFQPRPVYGATA